MSTHKRENEYIKLLSARDHSVAELASMLFVSEPTVRRDIITLKEQDLLTCFIVRCSILSEIVY